MQVTATTDTVSMAEAARILALPGERVAALIGERRLMPTGLLDGDLRFRRSDVEALGTRSHARTHHHAVQFYESESFLVDVVTQYVAEGLKARAPIVVIARPERTRLFVTRLDLDGHGGSEAVYSGELVMLDAHATLARFMVEGQPDEARFRSIVEPLILRTTRAWPGARLRAYGEMVDILWEQGNPDGALKLEGLWNGVAADHSFTLLCGYGMSRFQGDGSEHPFHHVCDTHSDVLPTEACGQASSIAAQRREMALLQRRIQVLETQLAAAETNRSPPPSDPAQDVHALPGAAVAEAANSPGEKPLPELMTVLVIDDDLPSRRLLVEALLDIRRPRIGILEARSVEQAMRVLDECSPDLCITDFRLTHGQTGLDLFMAARARGHLAPFVGITGAFVEDQLAEKLLSAGFEDVMLKQQLNETNLYRIIRNAGLRGRNARKLMALGTLDELTGVLNRRGYLDRLEAERIDCEKTGKALSVLYLDLDNMKQLNDRHGHRAGDEALKALVRAVLPLLRKSDLVGRLGGDEFSVALPGTGAPEAQTIVRRLRDRLREAPLTFGDAVIEACVSAGVHTTEDAGRLTTAELIERADAAMFEDKMRRRKAVA